MVGIDFQTKPTQPNIFKQEKRIFKQENEYLSKKKQVQGGGGLRTEKAVFIKD
jgi:hypothetical protein